jgi:hypothetical protein
MKSVLDQQFRSAFTGFCGILEQRVRLFRYNGGDVILPAPAGVALILQ